MSRYAPVAARSVRRAAGPVIRSVSRFRWQARSVDLEAVTAQVGTLVRPDKRNTLDSAGNVYTVGHSMPRWEARTWAGDRQALGIRLNADDLTWPCNWVPERASVLIELAEAGTRTTAGAGLLYLGRDDQTGARLIVDSDGTNYRATIHNGTSSASATLATATPTSGQLARLVVQLDDDGTNQRVRLALTPVATGITTETAWSSTVARAAAWGSGATLRLNRVGSAGTQGSTWIRQVAWMAGLLTASDMLARL
jgi:hypothetical protein